MKRRYKKLTYKDRQQIEQMRASGTNPKTIAEATGTCYQTIYRELQRGKDENGEYRAEIAQKNLFC